MGDLEVTIRHGGQNNGPIYVAAMFTGGMFIMWTYAATVSTALATLVFWVMMVCIVCVCLFTAARIYVLIRDKPTYEAMQKDTQYALDNQRTQQLKALTQPEPTQPVKIESARTDQLPKSV